MRIFAPRYRRVAIMMAALAATSILAAPAVQAVTGGAAAGVGTHSFVVKLTAPGTRACSGVLIDPQWVLTASSCFPANTQPGAPAQSTTAAVGRTDLTQSGGYEVPVAWVIPRTDRPVTLARLATPVADVTPIRLASTPAQAGEPVRIAGFGRTATEWVPNKLQTATAAVASVDSTTLALTDSAVTTCKGDAGGPAIRETGSDAELLAINATSWQHGCLGETETQQGTTEARVDDLGTWMAQEIMALAATPATGHAITLTWGQFWALGATSYRVYGSTSPNPTSLLATTTAPGFVHKALPAKQTWYYKVVPVNSEGQELVPSPVVSATVRTSVVTDFDKDGRDDVATFTRGTSADVFVSLSDGGKFAQDAWLWQNSFVAGNEIPLAGDFDGDGKTDVATFQCGDSGKVYVALSTGTGLPTVGLWHNHFCIGAEIPAVGDFDGDGKDDIATFTRGTTSDVFISLSDGHKFVQDAWKWHDSFAVGDEIPEVGDFDGDGKHDIATFTRGTTSDVYVSLSDGGKFAQNGWKWHDSFAVDGEIPAIGDFTGDGRDDIATFARGTTGDVFVSHSDGGKFVENGWKWHEFFSVENEVPGVGDFDGDGFADIITFTRGTSGLAIVAKSGGSGFGAASTWNGHFALNDEVPLPRTHPSPIG